MRTSVKDQSAVNGIMQGEMGRGRDSRAIGVTNGANGDCVLLCSTAAIMRPLLEGEPRWRRRAWTDAIDPELPIGQVVGCKHWRSNHTI
jgi:hypothetical protein